MLEASIRGAVENLLQAPHDYAALLDRDATGDRSGEDWLKLEGRVSKIRYEIPAGRSSLEVMRNYENALKGKGFAILFNCADRSCFSGKLQDPYLLGLQVDRDNMDSTLYFDHAHYMFAKLDMPDGSIYSAVLTGEDQQRVTAFVTVVEANAMKGDMIAFVDARSMEQAIAQSPNLAPFVVVTPTCAPAAGRPSGVTITPSMVRARRCNTNLMPSRRSPAFKVTRA